MKAIITGHIFLILCCVFYLLWWRAGYYPGVTVDRLTGKVGLLLYITAAFGLFGILNVILGVNRIPEAHELLPACAVVIGGAAVYVVLLMISRFGFHRIVTTELFLIVGWVVLEVIAVGKLYSAEYYDRSHFFILMIVIAAAVVISMFFYLAYYNVAPMTGFVFGMIPLITEAVSMVMVLLLLMSGAR